MDAQGEIFALLVSIASHISQALTKVGGEPGRLTRDGWIWLSKYLLLYVVLQQRGMLSEFLYLN